MNYLSNLKKVNVVATGYNGNKTNIVLEGELGNFGIANYLKECKNTLISFTQLLYYDYDIDWDKKKKEFTVRDNNGNFIGIFGIIDSSGYGLFGLKPGNYTENEIEFQTVAYKKEVINLDINSYEYNVTRLQAKRKREAKEKQIVMQKELDKLFDDIYIRDGVDDTRVYKYDDDDDDNDNDEEIIDKEVIVEKEISVSEEFQKERERFDLAFRNYTKEDRITARRLRKLHCNLGHPSDDILGKMLHDNMIDGCEYKESDIKVMNEILGPCLGCVKGKLTNKPKSRSNNFVTDKTTKIGERIHCDLIWFGVQTFFVGVDDMSGYIYCENLYDKRELTIREVITRMISMFQRIMEV